MKYEGSLGVSALAAVLAVLQLSSSRLATSATQNRDTVQKLYGRPVSEIYQTSQDLTVRATFASNGNLCRAHIRPEGDAGITDAQLKPVLDELAPKDVRGEYKIGTFLNVTCLKLQKPENSTSHSQKRAAVETVVDPCAECSGVSEDYERLTITKYGNSNEYSSVWITFHGPECEELDKARH